MVSLRRYFRYAVPSIVSMWVFSIYSMVDGIFVARGVGPEALAAVNLSLPFTNLMFSLGLVIATGTSTVVSILFGQQDAKKANGYFNQNLAVATVVGLAVTAVGLLALEPICRFLGATQATMAYTKEYVGTIACFAVFFIVSYNLEVLVKVDGMPQLSAVGVICCALMNVALDYVFVMVLGWGVRGAALATGLAQVTSTTIFVIYFALRGKKLRLGRFKPNMSIYRRVIPIGLADGVTELSNGIIIFLFNRVILQVMGEPGLVSYTVVSYVNTLVLMTMSGISQGMQPLTSLHHGMSDRRGCHRYLRYAAVTAVVMSVVFFFGARLGAPAIVSLFFGPGGGAPYAETVDALRLFAGAFLPVGLNVVAAAFFASIERPRYSLAISLARGLVLLAGSLFVMAVVFGETGIWLAPTVSEGLCLILVAVLARRYWVGLGKRPGEGAQAG